MATVTYDPLPAHLAEIQVRMEGYARDYGLDFYPTMFELVDSELDIGMELPLLGLDVSQDPNSIDNQLLLRSIFAQGKLLLDELTKFGR